MTQQLIAPWWKLAQRALEVSDWVIAEGALRRLESLTPGQPQILDLLGYSLLMQGEFIACEAVLREALARGGRSFWTPHKLGDALRGQQRMQEAIASYEQALQWGSDSPLTARNLLQVLDGIDPALALARLDAWAGMPQAGPEGSIALSWDQPPPWLGGACDAACTSIGPELAQWLHRHGCEHPQVRRQALESALLQLNLSHGLQLAEGPLGLRLRRILGSSDPLDQA
jgi:hypothetical protein